MKKTLCCVDTNAMLDFCYRYYHNEQFPTLWDALEEAVFAKQIQFIITKHIEEEIQGKITQFNYDVKLFGEFKSRFNLSTLREELYDITLLEIKEKLVTNVPIYQYSDPKKIDNIEADLSNISAVLKRNGFVLTSEQGFNTDITKLGKKRQLKIPDTCRYFNVECYHWIDIFNSLGIRL